jgi:hypothetical protein
MYTDLMWNMLWNTGFSDSRNLQIIYTCLVVKVVWSYKIIIIIIIIIIIFSGSAALRGQWPPRPRGFLITHNASQSVGLLWTSGQLVAETSTWQHITHTTDKHPCPGGIRTYDRRRRATVDLLLRPRGHWDRWSYKKYHNYTVKFTGDVVVCWINKSIFSR